MVKYEYMRDNLLSKERAHRMNSVELDKYYIENPDKKNDISQPYALFHFGIKWIPDAIAGYNNANGFIVQRIRNEAPDHRRRAGRIPASLTYRPHNRNLRSRF